MISKKANNKESNIEKYLARLCHEHGWLCLKYNNPQESGYPDRLILTNDGRTAWAELKATGARPRPLQVERMRQLAKLGHRVYCIDCREAAELLCLHLQGVINSPTQWTRGLSTTRDRGFTEIYQVK